MTRLIISFLFIVNFSLVYGQYPDEANGTDACETCKITSAESHKTVSYHQYIIEEFQQTEFDTMYMIQYAVVSEVISIPKQAIAISFYTNEGHMYMVVSDRYYSSNREAKAYAERVKAKNNSFCNYFVKPCIIAKNSNSNAQGYRTSSMTTRQMSYQGNNTSVNRTVAYVSNPKPTINTSDLANNGNFRIQFSWTKNRPFETLNQFNVEAHNGGYRQTSKLSFQTKQAAINWLLDQGYDLANFWIYPI